MNKYFFVSSGSRFQDQIRRRAMPTVIFVGCPNSLKVSVGILPQNNVQQLPSTSFTTDESLTIVPFSLHRYMNQQFSTLSIVSILFLSKQNCSHAMENKKVPFPTNFFYNYNYMKIDLVTLLMVTVIDFIQALLRYFVGEQSTAEIKSCRNSDILCVTKFLLLNYISKVSRTTNRTHLTS